MLERDPKLRPSCEQLLGNKYIVLALSKRFAKLSIFIHSRVDMKLNANSEVRKEQRQEELYRKYNEWKPKEEVFNKYNQDKVDDMKYKGEEKRKVENMHNQKHDEELLTAYEIPKEIEDLKDLIYRKPLLKETPPKNPQPINLVKPRRHKDLLNYGKVRDRRFNPHLMYHNLSHEKSREGSELRLKHNLKGKDAINNHLLPRYKNEGRV